MNGKQHVYQKSNCFITGQFSLLLSPDSPVPAPSHQPHISSASPQASSLSTPNAVELLPTCLIIFFPPSLLVNTLPAGLLVGPWESHDASNDWLREDLLGGLLLHRPCYRGTGHLETSTRDETRTEHPPPWSTVRHDALPAALVGSVFGGVFRRRCSPTSGWF